jgi:hypothetical protein
VFAIAVFVLVAYLAIARPDIQQPLTVIATRQRATPEPVFLHEPDPEFDAE